MYATTYILAQASKQGVNGSASIDTTNTSEDLSPRQLSGAWEIVIDSLDSMWTDFLEHLPLLIAALVVLVITWLVAKLTLSVVRKTLTRTNLRSSLRALLQQIAYILIWLTGLTIAATVVFPGMTPAKILTVLGLSSIAIGFAFKDIVENFFAGILILWRFPFDPGDFIECEGLTGKVEETTIRMTTIRQVDGQLVVIPNAKLFKSPVRVITSLDTRRTTIICGIAYDEDVAEAREIIEDAVGQCPSVNKDRNIEIFAQEFANSSINFEVTWWTGSTPLEVRQSRNEVVERVKQALDQANIEIPFPYRTLTFKQPVAINPKNELPERANGEDE